MMAHDPMQEAIERANAAATARRREQAETRAANDRALADARMAHEAAKKEVCDALIELLASRPRNPADPRWQRSAQAAGAFERAQIKLDGLEAARALAHLTASGADE